jgi:hypothetical protein
MGMKELPQMWIDMVMKTVTSGKVGIHHNGVIRPYFATYQGLRQGGPLSTPFFHIAMDVLAILVDKAQKHAPVSGLCANLAKERLPYYNMQEWNHTSATR